MANGSATSSQPANVIPTGAGPGYSYLSGLLIFVLALYLVVVTGVALYAMIELWPQPTPAGEPPPPNMAKNDTAKTETPKTETPKTETPKTETPKTETPKTETPKTETPSSEKKPPAAGKGEIPMPTREEIEERRARLCGTDKVKADKDKADKDKTDKDKTDKDKACEACVEREMQLQYESQRRYDPQCVRIFGCYIILWQEKRLLLLVLLAGALGALLHSIRYLSWFVGSRTFRSSWTAYYYLSPFAGAAVAFVAYSAIRGGFFSSSATTADANPFMFVALASIAGLFSREVLEKLKKIAESAFEPAPKTTDSTAPAKPGITSLDPNSVKVNFTGPVKVNGSGFTKDSKVQNGGTAMATTFVNDKQLTFVLPAALTAAPGKIDVVVVNAGGATSEAKQIEVTA
jgi:hypothetical protein